MVVPTFVRQALAGEPITVYGSGDQKRCFCHVHDSVDAVIRLIDEPDAVGQVFNIGSEEEISIRGLAERIRDRLGSDSEIVTIDYQEAYGDGFEDMERRQPDTSRLRELTGWDRHFDLDAIIDQTADHIRAE